MISLADLHPVVAPLPASSTVAVAAPLGVGVPDLICHEVLPELLAPAAGDDADVMRRNNRLRAKECPHRETVAAAAT